MLEHEVNKNLKELWSKTILEIEMELMPIGDNFSSESLTIKHAYNSAIHSVLAIMYNKLSELEKEIEKIDTTPQSLLDNAAQWIEQ